MNPVRRAARWVRYLPRTIGYHHGPRLMSWLRKHWVLFRNPQADIQFNGPVYLGPGFSLHCPDGGSFIVGSGVEFRRGFRAELAGPEGKITIDDGCYFTYDVIIACSTTIEVGKRVGLAQNTFIADGHHKFRNIDEVFLAQGYDFTPITIGDDVQVHSKVTIIESIGERAVIGANAVITRPIPPFCLAAGVPARVLDYFGPPGGEPESWEKPPAH